ncbi:hypothetical protein PVAND_015159 [Polypedilum vanderplanki]|uniref:TEP1-F n=1 Tax=Polypedilum vanderplanki TaxID=319348 RepID=A0A9J6BBT5_POLVA|nr:hypothetical protein PVAND_015159 [Polypedilum vanderplanki]
MNEFVFVIILYFCKFIEGKGFFTIVGPDVMNYQQTYPLILTTDGFDKPEKFELKIFGKLEGGGIYENKQTVTMSGNGMKKISFDLKSQSPGNYFIKLQSLSNSSFSQTFRLNLNNKKHSVLIQTDKAIYKPSDEVQFRVVIIDGQTKPIKVENVKVFITDPDDNLVKQYDKIYFRHGVFKQKFQLSDEPILGEWKIHVKVNNESEETIKIFEVDEYLLPTFDVKIITKENYRQDEKIVVSYDAVYTYGKKVEGEAILTAEIQNDWWWELEKKKILIKTLNSTTTTFDPKNDLNIQSILYFRPISITISFKEKLTGKIRNATTVVTIYEVPYFIEMMGSSQSMKPGITFNFTAFVKDINQIPVSDDKNPIIFNVTYTLDELEPEIETTTWPISWWFPRRRYKQIKQTFEKFLKDGKAEISMIATKNITSVDIEIIYLDSRSYFSTWISPTESNQYIQAEAIGQLTLSKPTTIEVISNTNMKVLNYIVIGRNKILASARHQVGGLKKFKFSFNSTVEMLPITRLIVFYLTNDGEIISDHLDLTYETELKNFLTINLSKNETKPNTLVNLTFKSMPNSYVGLLGVDQSVLLLKSGNDIDKNLVSNELSLYTWPNVFNSDWEEPTTFLYYNDFASTLVFTNAKAEYERQNLFRPDIAFPSAQGTTTSVPFAPPTTQIKPEVNPSPNEIVTRKFFPETWLFDCIENTNGTKTITKVIPDTITSWIITGFSLNLNDGLGLTKESSKLTVFQPFFIALNLPYSIKRGETIAIEVIIFNYMTNDLKDTTVYLYENSDFKFVNSKEKSQKITAKSNTGTSVKFTITPTKIGYITLIVEAISSFAGDKIQKLLLVEAEGITEYVNEAVLVDLRTQKEFENHFEVKIPNYAITDSVKIEASVIGDLLGPTIENLNNLINLPNGCGEQNMLSFVPDIVVLNYLTKLNKLTLDLQKKLTKYLEIGYQRELIYKHNDGSYSAFGEGDQNGSTWLTAFVIRSFNQASKFITIDEKIIQDGLNFLSSVQNDDGSFSENGIIFHKAMQGGATSSITMTAYILITYLENQNFNRSVVTKATDFLIKNVKTSNDDFAIAISSYALTLANQKNLAENLLKKFSGKFNNVEAAGYLLMTFDLLNRSNEVLIATNWLVKQRNKFGGFESTQETVVGLTALAQIAAKLSITKSNMKIDFNFDNFNSKSINVTEENSLVLQTIEIPSNVRKIDVTATGSGFSLLQISYHYNHNEMSQKSSIDLKLDVQNKTTNGYSLEICVGIKGTKNEQSNMAVVEADIISGYIFDVEDIKQRNLNINETTLKRIDFENGNTLAIFYFDFLTTKLQCLEVSAFLTFEIDNQKSASVTAYDYYDTSVIASGFYNL